MPQSVLLLIVLVFLVVGIVNVAAWVFAGWQAPCDCALGEACERCW